MEFNKKVKIAIVTVLILVLGIFIFNKIKSTQSSKTQYNTAIAQKGTLIVSLTTSGQVAATNSRTVTTTASGVVKNVYVKEGQKVTTGTPLMSIDLDLEGRQQLQSAYAQLQSAQNNLTSAQNKVYSLNSSLVSAKNIFDNQWSSISPDDPGYIQAHNNYLSALANFNALQATIDQAKSSLVSAQMAYRAAGATVYAPISGIVSAISLSPEMVLNPTSNSSNSSNVSNKIAIIKTNATPAISVLLTEIDVTKVKVGNKATITLDALPDKTYTGKVVAVDTSGTISSGVVSYIGTIKLDTDAPEILSNMSVTANIITDIIDNAIMVPVMAVQTNNGETSVRKLVDGKLTIAAVEVGKSNSTQIEIISGINEGDIIVTGVINSTTTTKTSSTSTSVFGGSGRGGAMFVGH